MFAHSLFIITTYLKMKPRSHLNLSLTHHLVQKRLKTENTCYIVVLFLGGFLTLVTLFSEEFSDFIKEVKKKSNIAFPRKKRNLPAAGNLITVLLKKLLVLHLEVFF